ncbi:hypothetical protein SAMN04487906_1170 [Zhouia amylolytica]|uniref:Uncharacterized protein n=1 Tax=Zhouia amylolytica TaxID=376730 RepID=A0A1I6RMK1_9FLAO|nr:hypothetical protein [Zhouia amylolytica]SFS65876.1 hypothetical protein SAMN04487906_1170 [Zhouia amylolytica]
MKTIIKNSDLHFEHSLWEKELLFWEDEIKSFKNRLSEIQKRWTDDTVLSALDQYENQFTIQLEKIDQLKDDIRTHEHGISNQLKANQEAIDMVGLKYHMEMRDRMETQRQIYHDLKKRFFEYLSKYL